MMFHKIFSNKKFFPEHGTLGKYAFLTTAYFIFFPDFTDNSLNGRISEKQNALSKRATEYWIRAWRIPEIRQQIEKADRV